MKAKLKAPAAAEIIFDAAYLLFAAGAGIWMLMKAADSAGRLYGLLALTLCFGDAFHLVPRISAQWRDTMEQSTRALGFGKLITSITMTLFYVLLYSVWKLLLGQEGPGWLTAAIVLLSAVRIALCLLPGNGWLIKNPPLRYAIYRNIPFVLLGTLVIGAFLWKNNNDFRWMPLAICLSFLFYLVVVLFAERYKALGALMLPKTCAYVWMICMGFALLP